jgi:DDE superfamily endonuclease
LCYDIYQGTTDFERFESFTEFRVLPECNPFPAEKSVIVMDNASFHHSERIRQMCAEAGVKLIYLPPYSPDFNPIEEFFSELKAFIKRNWRMYLNMTDRSHQAFAIYLKFCVKEAGSRAESARGHFKHAGLDVNNRFVP